MTIHLDLQPEVERGLAARAKAQGVSLADYAQQILAREASGVPLGGPGRTGQDLIEICARVQGILTDQEIDRLFGRNRSLSRPVELE